MNEQGQRRQIGNQPPGVSGGTRGQANRNPLLQSSEAFNELKFRLHQRLIEELDASKVENPDLIDAAS